MLEARMENARRLAALGTRARRIRVAFGVAQRRHVGALYDWRDRLSPSSTGPRAYAPAQMLQQLRARR